MDSICPSGSVKMRAWLTKTPMPCPYKYLSNFDEPVYNFPLIVCKPAPTTALAAALDLIEGEHLWAKIGLKAGT